MKTKLISIIIPNYNGRELLRENLPVLLENVKLSENNYEIIVVDDYSSDGSVDLIRTEFDQVHIIALDHNYGFSYACNTAVQAARGRIVYLLNSDIKVRERFLEPVLPYFAREDVFAVGSIEDTLGIPLVKFKFGIFWYWYCQIKNGEAQTLGSGGIEVFCVSGGHSAYARDKFLALGGFDALFRPFYAEDGDICWRAWKRGWKSIIEPKSEVMHEGRGTIGKLYSSNRIQRIHWKNRTLLTWKNLTSARLLIEHLVFLLPLILGSFLVGKKEAGIGVLLAFRQLPELLMARKQSRDAAEVIADEEFFRRFSSVSPTPAAHILYLHETSRMSGAEQSLLYLSKYLNRRSFRPFFVVPHDAPFPERLRNIGATVFFETFPPVRKFIGVLPVIKKLRVLAKENGIRIIHSNSIRTHIYAVIVGKLEGIPVIWHQRNLISGEAVDPDRLLAFLPDRIICNSFSISRRFMTRGGQPKKVSVVHNGVDTEYFSPVVTGKHFRSALGLGINDIVIGIASRFGPDKGHETFLKASQLVMHLQSNRSTMHFRQLASIGVGGQTVSKVYANGPRCSLKQNVSSDASIIERIKFIIVGGPVFSEDRWREEYLKTMAVRLGLHGRVVFTGFQKNMPEAYAAMDIFVLASQAEPCGRVVLEAMAMAKPIIATDTGGTPEMIDNWQTGILIPPGNAHAMARAMVFFASNKASADKMGYAARKKVETQFTIQKNVAETERMYRDLLMA